MSLKLGQVVMLIGKDDFMPPIGAIGEVIKTVDSDGDCEVMFEQYPCPVESPEWVVPQVWLIPIQPNQKTVTPKLAEVTP